MSSPKANLALLFFAKDSKPLMAWPIYYFNPSSKIEELSRESDEWAKRLDGKIEFVLKRWIKTEDDLNNVKELVKDIDGLVIYILTTGLNYSLFFKTVYELNRPTLILTEPYYSLIWPRIAKLMREGRPVIGISSSNREDFIKGLRVLYTHIKLKGTKVVAVSIPEEMSLETLHRIGIYVGDRGPTESYYKNLRKYLNIEFISYSDFLKVYESIGDEEATKLASEIKKNAYWIRSGISDSDLIKAVKVYLAAKKLIKDRNANAFTINCFAILLKDINALPVTPCIAISLLNDEGIPAACEADLSSLIMQVIFKHLADRPSWIVDPIIDFSGNYIIHAHCTAPTKMRGYSGKSEPYALDTHDESGKPVVMRTKMSVGEVVTVAQISSDFSKLLVHVGKIEDTPIVDLACRTKIKIKAKDVKEYLWNYEMPLHRVVVYGDWVDELRMLSKLMGLQFQYELPQ